MANQFRVLRHIRVAGAMRKPGDLLDAADVRNPQVLIDQRYIVDAGDDSHLMSGAGGPTPDPKIAQDRMVEKAAGRQGGPEGDIASDSPVQTETPQRLKGKLPKDFPGHKALDEAGLDTYAKVRKQLDNLEDLDGIGPKTAVSIRDIFAAEGADDGTDDDEAADESGEPGDSTVPKASNA